VAKPQVFFNHIVTIVHIVSHVYVNYCAYVVKNMPSMIVALPL